MIATLEAGSAQPALRVATGPFLVATDGSTGADGAVRAAALLAGRFHASVEVVTVLEPLPVVAPEIQIPVTPELQAERRAERLTAVRAQMVRLTGSEQTWPVTLCEGRPPETLAERAAESHASLVIIGIGRHRVIDRLLGDETALRLLRQAHVPVLAVPATLVTMPARAVVATDFSDDALRAARDAVELLGEQGTMYLVHVVTREVQSDAWETWEAEYSRSLAQSFERMKSQLRLPPGIKCEAVTLRGDPAHELLQYAGGAKAELIATGSHGHGFFSRLLLGSVATRLIRGAQCTVLAVPRPVTQEVEDAGGARDGEPRPAAQPVFAPPR